MFPDRNLLVLALVFTVLALGLSNGSWAADVFWDGGGDGSTWNDNQNWAGDNGPGDGDDRGILGDTTVDRTVVINPHGPDESLGWEQTTSGAVNKIQLNTDWNPSQCCHADLNYVNTTGDPGALVLDLNGFRKHQLQGATHAFPPMTIMSSQPGGELVYARKLEWAANEVIVGENVTIRSRLHGYNNTFVAAGSELAWDPNSKLIVEGEGPFTGATKFGDVDVVNNADWGNNGFFTIQGDLNIEQGSNINLLQGTPQRMALMGNITDLNTTSDYTDGRLEFVGSGNLQEINIHRTLRSSINVKEQASVKLMHDLDASANIAQNPHEPTWISTGTIDLNGFDFLTNQLVVGDNSNIIWGAGTDSSVIEVNDRLGNIGPFNVTIVDQGGWNSGDDFVLFDYAGKKDVYGPTLGSVVLPSGWQHGGLIDTGDPNDPDAPGTLVLSNLQTSGGATGGGDDGFTWNRAGGGSWNTSTNWSPGGAPDSQDHTVTFDSSIAGGTVAVESSVTVNKMSFDNGSDSFTVAGPGGISLQASAELVDPSISVAAGSHTISADIHQVDGVTVGVADGASLTVGAVNLDGGIMQKDGAGELRIDGTAAGSTGNLVANAGTISGSGTVGGDFVNVAGTVAPGSSAGILTVGGIYNQGKDATLSIELGGTTAGDDYDRLVVGGMASLDGTLKVSLIDGFTLAGSLGFDVLDFSSVNGDFATLNLPAGMTWDVSDGTLSFGGGGVGLPGDFNGNGTVDAADYVVWSDNRGAGDESALGGNGNGTGGVDQADYLLWKNNFGNTSGGGNSAAIPEPAALSLLLVTALGVLVGCRRR